MTRSELDMQRHLAQAGAGAGAGHGGGRGRLIAAMVFSLLLWASAFPGIRAAMATGPGGEPGYPPQHVSLLRFLIASVALGAYALVKGIRRPAPRDLALAMTAGCFGIGMYQMALCQAETRVPAGAAALVTNTAPIFTAALATLLLGERMGRWAWLGSLISFGGVALISFGQNQGLKFDPLALLLLLPAIGGAIYTVAQKPAMRTMTSLEFTSYAMWTGTLCMMFFSRGLGHSIAAAPLSATLTIVYLGLFPAVLAYLAWCHVIARMPASQATNFLYLNPVISMLIAVVWNGEWPTTLTVAGGVLVLGGVVAVNRWKIGPASGRGAPAAQRQVDDLRRGVDPQREPVADAVGNHQ